MKIKETPLYITTLFLALGNIVWFAQYTLGKFKSCILVLLLIMNYQYLLNKKNYVGFRWFLLLLPFLFLCILNTPSMDASSRIQWLYGFCENYLFLILGYAYFRRERNTEGVLKRILPFTCFFCAIIVSNFFLHVPNLVSPIAKETYEEAYRNGYLQAEIVPIYSTGFGLGRTGWATTLASYLPLTLLFLHKKRFFLPSFLLIALTICLSASRGGLLLLLIVAVILFIKSEMASYKKILALMALAVIAIVVMPYMTGIEEYMRLGGGETDFTTGRFDQFQFIPEMLSAAGIGGLGIHGTHEWLASQGLDYDLHNTYFRVWCECGVCVGLFLIAGTVILSKSLIIDFIRIKRTEDLLLPLILTVGIFAALWEPGAVFGAVNWWSLWWFALGVYISKKRYPEKDPYYLIE